MFVAWYLTLKSSSHGLIDGEEVACGRGVWRGNPADDEWRLQRAKDVY